MATPKRPAKTATKARPPRKSDKAALTADWTPVPPPPPPVAWASAPAPIAPAPPAATRPVQGLRRALLPLLAVNVALTAVGAVLTYTVPGWGRTSFPFSAAGWLGLFFALITFGVVVPTIVVFCMWLHRVLANARDRHGLLDVSPGWAVGSFFIPFVHLVAPYFAVRKGYVADVSSDTKPLLAWFVPWSMLGVLAYLGGVAGMVITLSHLAGIDPGDDDARDEARDAAQDETTRLSRWTTPFSLALNVAAAWFLARLVRTWSDLQERPGSPAS